MNFTDWLDSDSLADLFDTYVNPWYERLPLIVAYPLGFLMIGVLFVYWLLTARWLP